MDHQFLSPCFGKGRVVQFSATHRGGSCYFTTGIGTHLTQLTTELTPSSSKLRKRTFRPVAEKVHLAGEQ